MSCKAGMLSISGLSSQGHRLLCCVFCMAYNPLHSVNCCALSVSCWQLQQLVSQQVPREGRHKKKRYSRVLVLVAQHAAALRVEE